MKKIALLITSLAVCTFVAFSLTTMGAEAKSSSETLYRAKCVVSYPKDGKQQVMYEPELMLGDGVEGAWIRGRELPVELGEIKYLPDGEEMKVQIHDLGSEKARVSIRFARSEADLTSESDILIRETAVRTIKTIALGETITLSRDDGAKAEITITAADAQ